VKINQYLIVTCEIFSYFDMNWGFMRWSAVIV